MLIRNIVHLTSAHPRYDTRIFLKECISLASHGNTVSLIVADGLGYEVKSNVSIHDVGTAKNRLDRMKNTPGRILKKALELNADVYHLHDPELIPIGLKLKKQKKIVIFDAHEDIPKQILSKPYLNKPLRYFVSKFFSAYEKWACPKLDAVVAATPFIRDKYNKMRINCIDVNNYPILSELSYVNVDWSKKKSQVGYVGGLERIRGIREMVQAIGLTHNDIRFALGGNFSDVKFQSALMQEQGWSKTDYLGWLNRDDVKALLENSVAGLVTLHPTINYLDSLPVKMFEYMASGIPVIASDFPLWKDIIESNACGICVNPLSPSAIAHAIDYLVSHPEKAEEMGLNGRNAVKNHYNWAIEEQKLLSLYSSFFD